MAQNVSADQQVINFTKYWYTDRKFENLLVRNDPFAELITKTKIGGQAYRFAAMYGRGGNVSGNAIIATTIANNQSQSRNAEWIVPPGHLFSVFNITQLELLATSQDKGAYISAMKNKFFAGTEALRKTFAKTLYGFGCGEQALMGGRYGFGVVNTVNNATATATNYAVVSSNIANVTAGVGTPTGTPSGATFAGFIQLGTWNNSTQVLTTNTGITVADTTGLVTFSSGSFNAFVYQFENYSDIVGIDIGSVVQFTTPVTTGLPTDGFGSYNSALYFNVVAINGLQVTFVSVGASSATPYSASTPVNIATVSFQILAGSWMVLAGGMDSSIAPNMPFGLGAWIPYVANRAVLGTWNSSSAGALSMQTVWTTYIATTFCSLNRSIAPDRLAGAYYFNTSGINLSDAVLEGTRLARRNGARNKDLVVLMNDVDLKYIMNELGGVSTNKTTYFQQQGSKSRTTSVTKGLSDINWQFMTSWLDRVLDSPYVPQGYCWILDESSTEFIAITDVTTPVSDGVSGNEPGTPDPTSEGDGPDLSYRLNISDYMTVQPASILAEGPGAQVIISLHGNMAVHNPAHSVAIRLY